MDKVVKSFTLVLGIVIAASTIIANAEELKSTWK